MKNMTYFQTSMYRRSLLQHPKSKSVSNWTYKLTSQPSLEVKLDKEYVKKLYRSTLVTPFLTASKADTGAQVIILGHTHLAKMGKNISCLHRTDAVMNCANATAMGAMAVFFGCVRGKSEVTNACPYVHLDFLKTHNQGKGGHLSRG